jgi:2-amino-4-hydroxy-6-hydroxymethyldihydropteridine diphosphokinase
MNDVVEQGGHQQREPLRFSRGALVALGSNLAFGPLSGPALLAAAITALEAEGLVVLAVSHAWRSPPWPPSDQPDYCNACVALDAGARTPQALLALLMAVERRFGRTRGEPNAPRTLDLDLIDLNGLVVVEDGLVLPHPRCHARAFVLAPLTDIAPGWRHPRLGETAAALLAAAPERAVLEDLGPIRTP